MQEIIDRVDCSNELGADTAEAMATLLAEC